MMIQKTLVKDFFLAIVLFPLLVSAQKDAKKYKEESEAIRKEIWAWQMPEFKVRNIPADFANASKVVIARHIDISSDSRKRTKFVGLAVAVYRELTLTEIYREAVKINDKSSVSEYSEFGYTQLEKRSGGLADKTTTVFIGVKVIKPDGTIKEINADDIVLTKDEKREKEAKAAVPDLQPGDIVDYFIAKQTNMTQLHEIPTYTFSFFDDCPVMSYSIHCDIGKKYAIEYRCYNGAPDFRQIKGEDDANVLDVKKQNIRASVESSLWTAPYRQLPIIRMNIMVGYKGLYAGRMNTRTPGVVYKNQPSAEFVEDELNRLGNVKRNNLALKISYGLADETLDYYKKLAKNKEKIPADSFLAELFYLFRFSNYLDVFSNADIDRLNSKTQWGVNESEYAFRFGEFLKEDDMENQLVFLTPRGGPELKQIMSTHDINFLLHVPGARSKFMGMTDIFTQAFYIPSYFEDSRQAITVDLKGRKEFKPKNFDHGLINVPGTQASENSRLEKLRITPVTDGATLLVTRNTTLKGHYKSDEQKRLILFEDFCNAERKAFGINQTVVEEMQNGRKSKKYAEELKAGFDKARSKKKEDFEAEAKAWFSQEITDLADYKVENLGVRHNSPDFVYRSKFKIGGLMKKAGNNFIIEVGKLQGSPLQVKSDNRKRTLDIHMPFARSIKTELVLEIPQGYAVEGVNALNKKVENECGSFIVEAIPEASTLTIKVYKSYNHSFEVTANWEKLLAFIDASAEWVNAKVLLKKK